MDWVEIHWKVNLIFLITTDITISQSIFIIFSTELQFLVALMELLFTIINYGKSIDLANESFLEFLFTIIHVDFYAGFMLDMMGTLVWMICGLWILL